ncbi:tyrosine-type recombinase/integrase [Liquorilactobacillus satsumensis]|uniref:tyrosine-type recombinase/integrase n=1 Tax=Liquorilactobacillus satsumensis TaxID=259059 RepID=UPI0039ED8CCA
MATKTRYANVYQDTKGHFFYQVFVGRDGDGKQRFKKGRKASNGRIFRSAHEAHKEAVRVKNEYLEHDGRAPYRMTYKSFMENEFIPAYRADVEKSTFISHKRAFNVAIKRVGAKLLEDITVRDCASYRTWLLTKSGFSKSYSSVLYIAFRQSLDYAVTLDLIKINVSRKTKSISKGHVSIAFWDKEQFEKVLSKICISDYYGKFEFILIWLYFMTGIRVSEGLALSWKDVDLRNKKLHICHTLDFKNKHEYTIKPYTKTINSNRTIVLDENTLQYLKKWKSVQQEHGVFNFVLSYDDAPVPRSTVSRIVKRYAKLAGVPEIAAKSLRHSHVSYLINEFNADLLVVSQRLGHSGPDITLKHYSHLWDRNDDKLAKLMTDNINVRTAKEPTVYFNGNQTVKVN